MEAESGTTSADAHSGGRLKRWSWLGANLYSERWRGYREALNLVLVAGNVLATVLLLLYYQSVPRQDVLFVLGFFPYLLISNYLIGKQESRNPVAGKAVIPLSLSILVQLSIAMALVAAILLPWLNIYLTGADPDVLQLVSPHTFCFSSQVLLEFWFYKDSTSTLIRILIPIIFNAYRVASAWTWFERALYFDNYQLALAAFNLLQNVFTLFFVLLLRVLPIYINPGGRKGSTTPSVDASSTQVGSS